MPRYRQYVVYPYEAEFGFSPGFYGPGAKTMEIKMPALGRLMPTTSRRRHRLSTAQRALYHAVEEKYRQRDEASRFLWIVGVPIGVIALFGIISSATKPRKGVGGLGQLIDVAGPLRPALDRMAGAAGKTGAGLLSLGAGGLVILGTLALPSEFAITPYLRIIGITAGVWMGVSGALYAFAPETPPETPPVVVAERGLFVSGDFKRPWFGSNYFALRIENKREVPLRLVVQAQQYLGRVAVDTLEKKWNDVVIDLRPGEVKTENFYPQFPVPGDRVFVFRIVDAATGREVTRPYQATVVP